MSSLSLSVLLDENFERQVIAYLEREGHTDHHVVDVLEQRADDATEIAPYARGHDLIVVTKDTDFLRMDDSEHAGVFFLVDHGRSAYEIATAIFDIAEAFPDRDHLRGIVYLDDWMDG